MTKTWNKPSVHGTQHIVPINYTHQTVWTVEVRTGICRSSSRPEQLWDERIRVNDRCGTEHRSSHDEQETRKAPPPGQGINPCYGCGASYNRKNCCFCDSTCCSCKQAGHTERVFHTKQWHDASAASMPITGAMTESASYVAYYTNRLLPLQTLPA